jgi:hypothetical protein
MKKFLVLVLTVFILVPLVARADSATIKMVNLTLIDEDTNKEITTSEGFGGVKGDLAIRCYGYKWKEMGYGQGFEDKKPANYTPTEVYFIKDYYKGSYKFTDLTSYIRFMTIDYCDLELVTDEGVKYLAEKYNIGYSPEFDNHTALTDDNNCQFSEEIMQGEICKMEVEVKKVDNFNWEDTSSTNKQDSSLNEDEESNTNSINVNLDSDREVLNNTTSNKPIGIWGQIKCWLVSLLGGQC